MVPRHESPAEPFAEHERERLAALNRALFVAWGAPGGQLERKAALREYLLAMTAVGRRLRMFEIANHRIFRAGERLIVPFDAHGTLSVHEVSAGGDRRVALRRFPHGTLVTDALVAELAGTAGEPIDLEREIYYLDVDDMPAIRITRMRDVAMLLERLNQCGSRHEAVYLLRFLVARVCSASSQGVLGAKNLQPEVARVRRELARLLNGPFAPRLRLPLRILVRNVSGLISRPKLIDELWQDTIDLAEVHVRGSAITNEIRRTAHHSLGVGTLELARAYGRWLATGTGFPATERIAAADEAARGDPAVRELVARLVSTLERLLGGSQIAERTAEWRAAYAEELVRCESGDSLDDELEALLERGVRGRNRWIYKRHLRVLTRKAQEGEWAEAAREPLLERLGQLEATGPDEDGFDAEGVARTARAGVAAFVERIRAAHEEPLCAALDRALANFELGAYLESFELSCALRHEVEDLVGRGVFPAQRYLLLELDCLLEELGYLALRHVASSFEVDGVRLDECLRIIHRCTTNLGLDGLFSHELFDLSAMLLQPDRTVHELLEVLQQIQRNYHALVHRVSIAYEAMAERLGYGANELRSVLANFQRTMHDLNSIVHFADLARVHLQRHGAERPRAGDDGPPQDPWDFVHLSHDDEVARRVEGWDGSSLLDTYGGKGSGLIYISYLGIATRDGFVLPTTLARRGLHRTDRPRLESEVLRHVRRLEEDLQRREGSTVRLGDSTSPLLLAVRAGSVFSLPGMLATVVFVGFTDAIAEELARSDEWYAWDAYRRFLASFAAAVFGLDLESLDLIEHAKRRHGVDFKSELSGAAMREVVEASKQAIRAAGHAAELEQLLSDPERQLHAAVGAVHASWDGERVRRFRAIKGLSDGWHTAVIVQQMASGNRSNEAVRPDMDERRISLTGVIPRTRMQATGFRRFTGDVKFSASGDDLVGGLTTAASFQPVHTLHTVTPMLARRLNHIDARLRRFRGTDPEIEFTVERGVLSVLQARSAPAESQAPPTTFVDPGPPAARGIGVCGGAFRGLVALDEGDVGRLQVAAAERGDVDGVLLVLENPTPDEIPFILTADALLTVRGGSTSHAAVAVHGIEDREYCAVFGAAGLGVHPSSGEIALAGEGGEVSVLRAGDTLSIHGQSGEVFVGAPVVAGPADPTG
jgi:hypothetical protein